MSTDCFERTYTVRELIAAAGFKLSRGQQASIGQTAARLCKERGITPPKIWDGRWNANAYSASLVNELWPSIRAIAAAGADATEGPLPNGSRWREHRPFEVER